MVQLGRMLLILDDDGARRSPQATVSAIPALVATVSHPNLRVDLRMTGAPARLPADAELAAYRIVQESLTNTVKHTTANRVLVRLDWTADELVITVTDNGAVATGTATATGGGRGLIGVRERAAACGGRAEAGPVPGGFRVTGRLPYDGSVPTGRLGPRPDGTVAVAQP
jgi:signal transduction histidine kinase